MSDKDALLRAVLLRPDDLTARLVFADWLDEQGDRNLSRWARMIREDISDPAGYRKLSAREFNRIVRTAWPVPFKPSAQRGDYIGWQRGFVEYVAMPGEEFVKHAEAIFRTHPVKKVRLTDAEPWEDDIADPPTYRWQAERRNRFRADGTAGIIRPKKPGAGARGAGGRKPMTGRTWRHDRDADADQDPRGAIREGAFGNPVVQRVRGVRQRRDGRAPPARSRRGGRLGRGDRRAD